MKKTNQESSNQVNEEFREKVSPEAQKNMDLYQLNRLAKKLTGIEVTNPKHAETLNKVNLKLTPLREYLDSLIETKRSGEAIENIISQVEKQIEVLNGLETSDDTEDTREKLNQLKTEAISLMEQEIKAA